MRASDSLAGPGPPPDFCSRAPNLEGRRVRGQPGPAPALSECVRWRGWGARGVGGVVDRCQTESGRFPDRELGVPPAPSVPPLEVCDLQPSPAVELGRSAR